MNAGYYSPPARLIWKWVGVPGTLLRPVQAKLMFFTNPAGPAFLTNLSIAEHSASRVRRRIRMMIPQWLAETASCKKSSRLQVTRINSWSWAYCRTPASSELTGRTSRNGITECPLAPGMNRTYTWQATQYGTYWYHSHFSSQYGDGIWGAIVINGPHSYNGRMLR